MFTLTIKTDNAAFSEDDGGPETEIARILRNVADELEAGVTTNKSLRDYNGNTVGEWRLSDARTSDSTALDAIAGLMHGEEWDADTTERVAEIVRETGREIGDPNE